MRQIGLRASELDPVGKAYLEHYARLTAKVVLIDAYIEGRLAFSTSAASHDRASPSTSHCIGLRSGRSGSWSSISTCGRRR